MYSKIIPDDTYLIVQEKTDGESQTLLNTELYTLSNWMILNQLTINPKKSTTIVIQSTLLSIPLKFQLSNNEACVKSSATVKYLGRNLDQHLNYKPHIESIAIKK